MQGDEHLDELPPSFPFYARDFLTSRAVVEMTPEARGGYIFLLCHAWLSPEQGVLPDDDALLAALSGLGADRWSALGPSIRRAFSVQMRDEGPHLVQHKMVAARQAQLRRREASKKGAELTNGRRWGSVAQRPSSESLLVSPASASASASALEPSLPEREGVEPSRARDLDAPRKTRSGKGRVAMGLGLDAEPTTSQMHSSFRPGLIAELGQMHPRRDVPLIARKLIEYQRDAERSPRGRPYSSMSKALVQWVERAERENTEPLGAKPFDLDAWASADAKGDKP